MSVSAKTITKYAVVYKATGEVYRTFDSKPEANYCVTDSFGPEWDKVTIQEIEVPIHKENKIQ